MQLQTWSDLVVKSCVELLHLSGINILVVFSDIPVFCLDSKLPTTGSDSLLSIATNIGVVLCLYHD